MNHATNGSLLRVSVATLDQVIFPHPQNGTLMLALERKASVINGGRDQVRVRAQPFGGAVRIFNLAPLREIIGEIKFDSERSKQEHDFRILIPPSKWEAVKQYCLHHLEHEDDAEIESLPDRELSEEFQETLDVHLKPDQYTVQPMGFVIENKPIRIDRVRGQFTVRLYRTFKVHIVDEMLCETMLTASQQYSDQ